jgi:hypothetical protein
MITNCECSGAIAAKAFAPQGGKAVINWEKPSLKCSSGRKATIKSEDVQPPCFNPPLEFGVGRHGVTYTYGYQSGSKVVKLQCPIEIDIIGMYVLRVSKKRFSALISGNCFSVETYTFLRVNVNVTIFRSFTRYNFQNINKNMK